MKGQIVSPRHGRRWMGMGATALLATALAWPAEAQRIVLVMDPPSAETNRFWGTAGDFGLNPSMHSLIGHDPQTGVYDDSGLAQSWEHNEDFTVWTFHLHPEAEFHFGWGPATAADVVHSYELHTQPESTLIGLGLMAGAELEVVDDHTIRFHLPDPRPNYLFTHAGRGSMFVYSKAQYDEEGLEGYDEMPAGTGPLEYVERRVGEGVLFRRVENHWSGQDVAFEELELRFVSEPSTKLAMLLSGEGHIADLPRELHPDALGAGHQIISSTGPAMQTSILFNGMFTLPGDDVLNPDLPWLDVRIRQAINHAIDREAMLDVLYDGRAEPLARFAMDPRHEGYAPELEARFEAEYGYNPERAKELLAEAEYPDAFAAPVIPIVSTVLPGNPEFGTMAELLQVFLDEVGFQTTIVEMDWASLTAQRRAREAQLVHPMRNAPIRPTEIGLDTWYNSRGRPFNSFESETVEALMEEFRQTLDPDARNELAAQVFTELFESYVDIPVAAVTTDVAINPEHIAGWTFPGVTSAGISHFHLIEPAQ
jgi:peptide/nickel transport system substrate-binding protein